jgi:hypothetical protein
MNILRVVLSAALALGAPAIALSHSGGLNSSGCHAGSKPYHCHRTQAPSRNKTPRSSGCNSNYSGCVPNASDVDCAGGRGNGPEYVRGPIRVIGNDIYGLDRDGDGIACE